MKWLFGAKVPVRPIHRPRRFRPWLEVLEKRELLAVEPLSLSHSSFWGASAAGTSGNASAFSSDGQLIAFESDAGNVTPNDLNALQDIFVRNVSTGAVTLISATPAGASGNGPSFNPRISADGNVILFESDATNLVAGDTNNRRDVFVRNLQAGTTTLVSINETEDGPGNRDSFVAALSANGGLVAFTSASSNLVNLPTDLVEHLYVRDLVNGATTLVSANFEGTSGANDRVESGIAVFDPDGQYVVFASRASDLVQNDQNGIRMDIFKRDLQLEETTLLSVNTQGVSGNQSSTTPVVSPDGRYVAFVSKATDLVAGNPPADQVYLRDLVDNSTTLISIDNVFDGFSPTETSNPVFSPDGRYLAYEGLVTDRVDLPTDLYARDLLNNTTILISANRFGQHLAGGHSTKPVFSPDGLTVYFASTATDLVADASDGISQIYARDLPTDTTSLLSRTPGGVVGGAPSTQPILSGDGATLAFQSQATGLAADDNNAAQDLFLLDVATGDISIGSTRSANLPAEFTSRTIAEDLRQPTGMSSDGRFVVFTSSAADLVANPVFSKNVYRHDRQTGENELVSVNPNGSGGQPGAIVSSAAAISADGRFVVFVSSVLGLVPGLQMEANSDRGVFVRDMELDLTRAISLNAAGQLAGTSSDRFTISSNGRYVALNTNKSLLAADTNSLNDVYVYDLELSSLILASVATNSLAGNGSSTILASSAVGTGRDIFSTNGRYLLFTSAATNLTSAGGTSEALYLRDLEGGTTTLVSVRENGTPASTFGHSLSGDGTRVAFVTNAQLLAADTDGQFDIYLYDAADGITLVTASEPFGGTWPGISRDGQKVLYTSSVTNRLLLHDLASGMADQIHTGSDLDYMAALSADNRYVAYLDSTVAPNGLTFKSDLYLHDVAEQTSTLASTNQGGTDPANRGVSFFQPLINIAGSVVAFASDSSDLIPSDINNRTDAFAYTRPLGLGSLRGEVFNDLNGDGDRDAGEGPRAGWMVFLDDNANGTRETGEHQVFTGANGQFAFLEKSAGNYRVAAKQEGGFTLTAPAAGAFVVTIVADETIDHLDFAIRQNLPDLAVQSIDLPAGGEPGQTITIDWTVKNLSAFAIAGAWQDAVYLSSDAALDASDLLLGTTPHSGGLGAGLSYPASAAVLLPAVLPGDYYILVQTDRRSQIAQADRANDVLASTTTIELTVPELTLGVPFAGSFTVPGERHYFQISPQAGQALDLVLDSLALDGATAVYIQRGALPTPGSFDVRGQAYLPDAQATVATTNGETYFVLVEAQYGSAAESGYTLTATQPGFTLRSVSSGEFGNVGQVTILIEGTGFTADILATLTFGTTTIEASAIHFLDASRFYASFNMTDALPGDYDVEVSDVGGVASLAAAVHIVAAGGPHLDVAVPFPAVTVANRRGVFNVIITNRGNTDTFIPIVWLLVPAGLKVGVDVEQPLVEVDQLLLEMPSLPGLPGILPAGASVRLPVYYRAPSSPMTGEIVVEVYNTPADVENGAMFYPILGGAHDYIPIDEHPNHFTRDRPTTHYTVDAAAPKNLNVMFFLQTDPLFPPLLWQFENSDPEGVPGDPGTGITHSNVWYGVFDGILRFGARLRTVPVVPWVQVVELLESRPIPNTIVPELPPHFFPQPRIDPVIGFTDQGSLDGLPFYWTVGQMGNPYTAAPFEDWPSIPEDYLAGEAARSPSRMFRLTMHLNVHAAGWDPFDSPGPHIVDIGRGHFWGYTVLAVAKTTEERRTFGSRRNFRFATPIDNRKSDDPNDIVGPAGVGEERYLAPGEIPYTINFENKATATLPAQEVFVTHQLDDDLDWTTFEFGDLGFGSATVSVPAGLKEYHTQVDYHSPDGTPLRVDINAKLDLDTGIATWAIVAVDPDTGALPENPFHGFLAINDADHNGEGFVNFRVSPRSDVTTGTTIDAQASIVFDVNAPIVTNVFTNTIDVGPPTSSVQPLDTFSPSEFTVTWEGTDDDLGSGIDYYDIYVSDNGGPYTLWLTATTDTSAQYTGQEGHTYRFFSTATDHVEHHEPAFPYAQAVTTVDATPPAIGTVNDGAADDIDVQASTTTILANWTGFSDAGSGIAEYLWAIGTTPGADDVQSFTSVGIAFNATAASLSLTDGATYYVSVLAVDFVGNVSASATSDGVTIDSTAPTSAVQPLPAYSFGPFNVQWAGSDTGTGLASYDIFVSDNGAAFTLFQTATTLTSALFTSQAGHRYRFYSIATDNAGNRESKPAEAEAQTRTPLFQTALPAVAEDATTPTGKKVFDLLQPHVTDPTGRLGVAVAQLEGNGAWQYSVDGRVWVNFAPVSLNSARLLGSSYRIRFVPARNWNGQARLFFHAWDGTAGAAGGVGSVVSTGAATPYSSQAGMASVTVNPVNDAPRWTAATATVAILSTQAVINAGKTIAEVAAAFFADVDGNATVGVAVVSLTGVANGAWQFSRDAGNNWIPFGAVSEARARLLTATDLIRFVPNPAFIGKVKIQFRAWDAASGTPGGTANLEGAGTTGGITAFGANLLSVTYYANSAPTLGGAVGPPLATNEDQQSAAVNVTSLLAAALASDTDPGALKGIAIVGATGPGTWKYSLNGTTWINLGTVTPTSARLLISSANVRFVPAPNQNGSGELTYRAWDQTMGTAAGMFTIASTGGTTALSANVAVSSLTVTPVNDMPVVNSRVKPLMTPVLQSDANPSGDVISDILLGVVSDVDAGALRGLAVIALTGTTTGLWQYSLDQGATWQTVGTVSTSSALLLRDTDRIRYVPNTGFLGKATFSFKAWDRTTGAFGAKETTQIGSAFSLATGIASVAVNVAPILNE